MSDLMKLIWNDREFNLTSFPYMWKSGSFKFKPGNTVVVDHKSDSCAPLPINAYDSDASVEFLLQVFGSSDADVVSAVAKLKHLIDGSDQLALRYHTNDTSPPVILQIRLSTSNRNTYWRVKVGTVDDGRSYYSHHSNNSKSITRAQDVVVKLRLEPYGYGDPIVLCNGFEGSPGFITDSNSDGLADGCTANFTPFVPFELSSDAYLHGGFSQRIETDSGGTQQRVSLSSHDYSVNTVVNGYFWVYVDTWPDLGLKVDIYPGAGASGFVIEESTIDSLSSDFMTDSFGNTWYKIPFSGTIAQPLVPFPPTELPLSISIGVFSGSTKAIFYLDMAYVTEASSYSGRMWSSSCHINNHPFFSNVNFIDIDHTEGDVSALVIHKIKNVTDFSYTGVDSSFPIAASSVGRMNFEYFKPSDFHAGFLASDSSSHPGWTSVTGDPNIQHGDLLRHITDGTSGNYPYTTTIQFKLPHDQAFAFFSIPRRVFAIVRTDHTQLQLSFRATYHNLSADYAFSSAVPLLTTGLSNWNYADLGMVEARYYLSDYIPPLLSPTPEMTLSIDFYLPSKESGTIIEFDALLFLPVVEDYFTVRYDEPIDVQSEAWIRGDQERVYGRIGAIERQMLGKAWHLPANQHNRFFYMHTTELLGNNALTTEVVHEVIPRTRHLL